MNFSFQLDGGFCCCIPLLFIAFLFFVAIKKRYGLPNQPNSHGTSYGNTGYSYGASNDSDSYWGSSSSSDSTWSSDSYSGDSGGSWSSDSSSSSSDSSSGDSSGSW